MGVYTPAGQILHFHDESYADLRLTRAVIGRMRDVLAQSGRIFLVPGDDWIGLRLETFSDVTLLVTLVSVAIKANLGSPSPAPPSPPGGAAGAAVSVASCGAGRRRITLPG